MTRLRIGIVGMVLVAGIGFAASAQDRTAQPGQPTKAAVWIENREPSEAVPVSLVASSIPPVVTTGPESIVTARAARQVWEYRDVRQAAGEDLIAALSRAGLDGWETTGIVLQSEGQVVLVVKRPR